MLRRQITQGANTVQYVHPSKANVSLEKEPFRLPVPSFFANVSFQGVIPFDPYQIFQKKPCSINIPNIKKHICFSHTKWVFGTWSISNQLPTNYIDLSSKNEPRKKTALLSMSHPGCLRFRNPKISWFMK